MQYDHINIDALTNLKESGYRRARDPNMIVIFCRVVKKLALLLQSSRRTERSGVLPSSISASQKAPNTARSMAGQIDFSWSTKAQPSLFAREICIIKYDVVLWRSRSRLSVHLSLAKFSQNSLNRLLLRWYCVVHTVIQVEAWTTASFNSLGLICLPIHGNQLALARSDIVVSLRRISRSRDSAILCLAQQ